MTEDHIGKCIRLAMAGKRLKATDLADRLGVVPMTVSQYRNGKCQNIMTLTKIAEACDLTLSEMLELA
jgi:transcriptional regulator with XRE-family HTH domain